MSTATSGDGPTLRIFTATNYPEVLAQPMEVRAPTGVWLSLYLDVTERMRAPGVTDATAEALAVLTVAVEKKLLHRGVIEQAEADALWPAPAEPTDPSARPPGAGDPSPTPPSSLAP